MEYNKELKFVIRKYFICIIALAILMFLLVYKPSVNNLITQIYTIISVIAIMVIGFVLPSFLYKIFNDDKTSETKQFKMFYEFCDFFSLFIVVCCLFQSLFVFAYFKADVEGDSMNPTLHDNEVLIVRSSNDVTNFDIVILEYNSEYNRGFYENEKLLVKRLIGMPGDTISYVDGELLLNGEKIEEDYVSYSYGFGSSVNLESYYSDYNDPGVIYNFEKKQYEIKEDYYFVMGDNRGNSSDSRSFGLFHKSQIVGKVSYRVNTIFNWDKYNGVDFS